MGICAHSHRGLGQSMSRGVWLETHNDLHHVKTPLPARYFQNDNGTVLVQIPKEDFHKRQSEQFVADTFGGSLPAFIAAFTKGKTLSDKDADEIQRLIDQSRIKKEGD